MTDYQTGLFTVTELAHQYGISRKTAYKWINRYQDGGPRELLDRARRPQTMPRRTARSVIDRLLEIRRRHPRWGAKKLLAVARREAPRETWPARSTVCDWLRREGLIASRPRARDVCGAPSPLQPIGAPNDTWTTDFKGEFRTGTGAYCYPLTLRDGFSRYVLRCDALTDRTYAHTRASFERAFGEFGLPRRIRSDNGTPFAGQGLARLSRLNVWWMHLGIVPERITPGRPEQNGSHEQFHAVLKAETTRPPASTHPLQQERFRAFVHEYNTERPHEALGDRIPADLYRPSPRPLPAQLPRIEYPAHMEVRRIGSSGMFGWHQTAVFLTEVLEKHVVGFEEIDDGLWTIYFGTVPIARFQERTRVISQIPRAEPTPTSLDSVLPMCPD